MIAQELMGTDGAISSSSRSRIGLEASPSEVELLDRLSFCLRGGRYPVDTKTRQVSENDMGNLERLIGRIRARYRYEENSVQAMPRRDVTTS